MAQHENLAAIDIGSNAIRMIIAKRSKTEMKVIKKFRFPIRLGADVFDKGKISDKLIKNSCETFHNFHKVMQQYNVSRLKAVGTSALREAKNQKDFVQMIHKKSSIQIDVIDGVEEARLIHLAVKKQMDLSHHRTLLIDIGGGSVELTFSENSLMSSTQSFPFGTVRTLDKLKKKKLNESQLSTVINDFSPALEHYIQSQDLHNNIDFAVGTGGNIETLGKLKPLLLKKKARSFLSLDELNEMIHILKNTSVKDRIEKLNLRPDRADVIIPAAMVVQTVLQKSKIQKIVIPYVGLKDGLLWALVEK